MINRIIHQYKEQNSSMSVAELLTKMGRYLADQSDLSKAALLLYALAISIS